VCASAAINCYVLEADAPAACAQALEQGGSLQARQRTTDFKLIRLGDPVTLFLMAARLATRVLFLWPVSAIPAGPR
jgi:hypothetical protein